MLLLLLANNSQCIFGVALNTGFFKENLMLDAILSCLPHENKIVPQTLTLEYVIPSISDYEIIYYNYIL